MTAATNQIVLGEEKGIKSLEGAAVLDGELIPGVRLTATGFEITDPTLPLEMWLRVGRMLGHIHRTSNWWIGDWIIKGEALYGEEAAQGVEASVSDRYNEAERITGLGHRTLINIVVVCSSIARSRRRAELGFWMHREVTKFDPEEQKRWLKLAVDNNWSGEDLVAELRQAGLRPAGGDNGVSGNRSHNVVTRVSGNDGDWDAMSDEERIESAARRVFHQGVVRNGEAHVPLEAWSQLASSLGEE